MVSKKQTPAWSTFNAESFNNKAAQVLFMRWCFDHRALRLAPFSWQLEFCRPDTIVVPPGGQPCVVLRRVAPMAILWPVTSHHVGPHRFPQHEEPREGIPIYMPVLRLCDWVAIPCEVASPSTIMEAHKNSNVVPMPSFFAKQTAAAMPLLP